MNKTFKLSATFLFIIFAALLFFRTNGGDKNIDFPEKIDSEGEVTVSAQPTASNSGMEIIVLMDTHTVDMEESLEEVSYLESNGDRYEPIEWIGDPPGGHHRSGSLFFDKEFTNFTLHIESIGGEHKKFNWK